MIREAIQHFFTPAPKHIKQMGYLQEAIAIEARAQRCASAWQPHLDKCKELILKTADKLNAKSNIMILGSGGLHDVPSEALLTQGHTVTCVDVVHLPSIVKENKKHTFVTRDVTGLIEPLYNATKAGTRVQPAEPWELINTPDLIISLNLLSQLTMKLEEYAKRHGDDLGILFSKNVLKAHVSWLRNQKTKVLLISDISREYWLDGELLEAVSSLPELDLPQPEETWAWDIAPKGEADKDISIQHNVAAWHL